MRRKKFTVVSETKHLDVLHFSTFRLLLDSFNISMACQNNINYHDFNHKSIILDAFFAFLDFEPHQCCRGSSVAFSVRLQRYFLSELTSFLGGKMIQGFICQHLTRRLLLQHTWCNGTLSGMLCGKYYTYFSLCVD